MNLWSKVLAVALVTALGVTAGYGWGNATHVLFSNCLGSKIGPLNQNEIYGSVLLDMFGYDFADPSALMIDYALHTESDLLWSLYAGAGSAEARALVYGCFTHSNSPDIKGADWYAHGVYPGDAKGWVIRQGGALASVPEISSYILELVGPEHAEEFGVVVGHTLVETAVDILVKRRDDPLVGGRLYLAARNRTAEITGLLSDLQAAVFPTGYPDIAERELLYREQMMQYGQLFMLSEAQMLPILSEQIAVLAQGYLGAMYGLDRDVDPARVSAFVGMAIKQVAPVYRQELFATLIRVSINMRRSGPTPTGPIFALSAPADDVLSGAETPSETTPVAFALNQNYPNPFNPSTVISYSLPLDAHVSLIVYNSIGQEVARLVDGVRAAGVHQELWAAGHLPSGVYLCRLTAGRYAETRKMTLAK